MHQRKKEPQDDGYIYWDGTASAAETGVAAMSSNIYRLWDYHGDDDNPPEKMYTVTYQYEGDVPPGIQPPKSKAYTAKATVTVAAAPTAEGYYFTGWASDVGQDLTAGGTFIMPEHDVTITGTWVKETEAQQSITVVYQYKDGFTPDGAPAIGGTGALIQSPYTVEVGKPHSVVTMPENAATYYRFGGWTPSLTINKTGVSLIHGTDGYYTGTDSSGKTYQWTSTLLRSYVSIYSDWKLFCNWENSAYVLHWMWKSYAWID